MQNIPKSTDSNTKLFTLLATDKKGVADAVIKIYNNTTLEDLDGEIWVDVYGYDGLYNVSNLGRVKSLERTVLKSNGVEMYVKERILKQSFIGKNRKRLSVSLCVNNIAEKKEVNTIVFYSFNPIELRDKNKKEVCHLSKNGLDNSLINLKLITVSESRKIGFKKGIYANIYKSYKRIKEETSKLKDRTCSVCLNKKDIKKFEKGRRKCYKCMGVINYERRLKKQGKESKSKPTE